jgi:hypothetical protein
LCAGFTLLLGKDTPTSSLSGALVRSVTKLANITFLSLVLSPTGSIYLGFITERRLATMLTTPSLGVPNWSVIYIINTAPSINKLHDIVERTSNEVKMLVKHFQMVQTQIDQLTKVQKDLLVNVSGEKHACEISTRSGASTQDPLYPKGHPKRIEQDSQRAIDNGTLSRKKKKKQTVVESSKFVRDPNSVSISDAEIESGNASDKEEVEEEPKRHAKGITYTKEDFIANKHGSEREPWVQKPMPFPNKKHKSKEEEHYNKFCDG